jgi:hypothetical protein
VKSPKDKNGFPLLPDLIEINLEGAFSDDFSNKPIEIKIDIDTILKEADHELVRIVNEVS